jgi:hypothetical protein
MLLRRASANRRTSQLLTGQRIVCDVESVAPKRSALLTLSGPEGPTQSMPFVRGCRSLTGIKAAPCLDHSPLFHNRIVEEWPTILELSDFVLHYGVTVGDVVAPLTLPIG